MNSVFTVNMNNVELFDFCGAYEKAPQWLREYKAAMQIRNSEYRRTVVTSMSAVTVRNRILRSPSQSGSADAENVPIYCDSANDREYNN